MSRSADTGTLERINLSVLRRRDAHVASIACKASHAALYEFSTEWVRCAAPERAASELRG